MRRAFPQGITKNRWFAGERRRRGGIADCIDYRGGNALEIIDQTEGDFDIIYNDIDKDGYPEEFQKAIPRLRRGGLFIIDNMLWGGRVVTQDTVGVVPCACSSPSESRLPL